MSKNKQQFQVGPDELNEPEFQYLPSNYKWIIYYYINHGYDGNGYALIKLPNRKYLTTYLGHCSCYGPLDQNDYNDSLTVREALEDLKDTMDIHDEARQTVLDKWKEIEPALSIFKKEI